MTSTLMSVAGRRGGLGFGIVATVAVAAAALSRIEAQGAYDSSPNLTATAILGAGGVKGPNYQIAEAVRTDEFFHEFAISSPYGSFEATGRTQLAVRIQEIAALAALDEVSKSQVFLASAGNSVVKIGQGAAAAVSNPEATVKGLGAGIKRAGVNLGRRTERAVSTAGEGSGGGGSTAGSAANNVLGVNSAMRRWAYKVRVDPYTTNDVLRKALADFARVDAAGSLATRVVVPIPGVVGLTSTVGNIVWSKDPEEVRKINEAGLRALKVPDAVATALFGNQWFTLTYQTRFIAALGTVSVPGVADYVRTASEATSERAALFFVESAEMLQQWRASAKVSAVLTDSRALVAVAGGQARALLPLDWLPWTATTHKELGVIAGRARKELQATRLEIGLTGRMSERASREVPTLGWTMVPDGAKR